MQRNTCKESNREGSSSKTSRSPIESHQHIVSFILLCILSTSNANNFTNKLHPRILQRRFVRPTVDFHHLQHKNSRALQRSLILSRGGSSNVHYLDRRGQVVTDERENDGDIKTTKQNVPRGGFGTQKDGNDLNENVNDTSSSTKVSERKNTHQMSPRLANMIRLLFITYYGSLGALMPFVSMEQIWRIQSFITVDGNIDLTAHWFLNSL